jgi:hypothetical protein
LLEIGSQVIQKIQNFSWCDGSNISCVKNIRKAIKDIFTCFDRIFFWNLLGDNEDNVSLLGELSWLCLLLLVNNFAFYLLYDTK